ncbi:hypothetical protein FOMPIDRAFT_1024843 [Fomitopsis schrenkii]|uniref:Uncharacterized protein n=1 Tax=Fomitopsis schrenkii TaxID=2126942 RepID=S8F8D5_FOMSC|nr:hypothetical protein FOMPIDRAFT_1024843 [Fomitopsis schrenkii]
MPVFVLHCHGQFIDQGQCADPTSHRRLLLSLGTGDPAAHGLHPPFVRSYTQHAPGASIRRNNWERTVEAEGHTLVEHLSHLSGRPLDSGPVSPLHVQHAELSPT